MQWFKHDTDATMDFKIKKLLIKYGAIGYAIYFHCLELIAGSVSEKNITFELEHDAEIIADDLRISGTSEKSGKDLVEEIMRYMIELNLFEESNGHIFCFKLLNRMDSSMTSSPRFRELINKAKETKQEEKCECHDNVMISHDDVMINHDNVMQEKKRIEKITKEKIKKDNIRKEKNSYSEQTSCSESTEPHDSTLSLILNDNTEWTPSQSEIDEFSKLYPNVDVIAELRKMRGWCIGNPKKRKTRYGVKRFVTAWLGKEQDKPSFTKKEVNSLQGNCRFRTDYTDEEYRAMSDDPTTVAF